MTISDPGRGLVRRLGVTAAALFAFAAASQQRAEALSLASPGTAPSAKFATDGLTTEVQHRGGGGGFRGGGGGGFRGGGGGGFRGGGGGFRGGGAHSMAAASAVAARPFTAVVSEVVGWRSTVAVFVRRPSSMAADTASHIVTRFHRSHFVHRHHFGHRRFFHRRFYYAPAYYTYPAYYYPRRCRVIWTYYGPRKICRYRPWHAHYYARYGLVRAETKQAPVRAPVFSSGKRSVQSQSLPSQGLIFQGVSFASRHCAQCSGGQ